MDTKTEMIDPKDALSALPTGLRKPLIDEYTRIVQNYAEHRWGPAELSGGLFCEIAYTILDGHAKSVYASNPSKPRNFVGACRGLESNSHVPRSFQILIPRLLPGLYEVRNNRGVGHVGGDVDPNSMDAAAVLAIASWIMSEFVRVFHSLDIGDAQRLVDALADRPLPLVWEGDGTKILLDTSISLRNQVLVLLSSSPEPVPLITLQTWLKYKNRAYLKKLLVALDEDRFIHITGDDTRARLLPPGSKLVSDLIAEKV